MSYVTIDKIDKIQKKLGIEPDGLVQSFLTHTCRIHNDKYLPFDTGTLANTVDEGTSFYTYEVPYAERVYYGEDLNFQTDKHPLAGAFWDKRMVSAEINDIVDEVQKFVGGK